MHLNHAVENNKYNVFLSALDCYDRQISYYRVDFDAATASSLSCKAVKVDLPVFSSVGTCLVATDPICLGSCNGIFCFSRYILFDSVIASLWNPSTQEYKEIVYKKTDRKEVVAYGFAYDCKIDDYKLILIFREQHIFTPEEYAGIFIEILVYTLGSGSWSRKKIGNTPYIYGHCGSHSMKLSNGAMHFVAKKLTGRGKQQKVTSTVIVSFDIAEETTKEIQLPSCLLDIERHQFRDERVDVFGKDLYFSVHISGVFELWVMKDYGVVDSWTKLLIIPELKDNIFIRETLLFFNMNRQILFNYTDWDFKNGLVSYDLENGSLTFWNTDDTPEKFTAETFTESLVSLAPSR